MIIIEDTRQQANKHEQKHTDFESFGDVLIRSKLIVGDYCSAPSIAVDTKQDISEIAANMCGTGKEKRRFTNECKLAKEIGCKLVFLIEDKRYKTIDDLFGKSIWLKAGHSIPGDRLATAMYTMSARYGIEFAFCSPEKSASYIKEILTEKKQWQMMK